MILTLSIPTERFRIEEIGTILLNEQNKSVQKALFSVPIQRSVNWWRSEKFQLFRSTPSMSNSSLRQIAAFLNKFSLSWYSPIHSTKFYNIPIHSNNEFSFYSTSHGLAEGFCRGWRNDMQENCFGFKLGSSVFWERDGINILGIIISK